MSFTYKLLLSIQIYNLRTKQAEGIARHGVNSLKCQIRTKLANIEIHFNVAISITTKSGAWNLYEDISKPNASKGFVK